MASLAALACFAVASRPLVAAAQLPDDAHTRDRVAAGFEMEQYLRVLQDVGLAPLYPWSVRGFGPKELDYLVPTDTTHPWHSRLRRSPDKIFQAYLLAPQLQAIYNSAFPYGYNDGPIWAGRGLTSALDFGAGARWGPLSLVIGPEVFRAENEAFVLKPNGLTGNAAYRDPHYAAYIDQPQRFGNSVYQKVDPGQSTLRLDLSALTLGMSTANEYWGPASAHPIILGNNAAGFPHAFLGTSRPLGLWRLQLHGRVLWGRLDQSPFSPFDSVLTRRFMTAAVGTMTIRGVPGLEIGGTRFFHIMWPAAGISRADFTRTFAALFKASGAKKLTDNQLASVFGRWVFPQAGIELYGEFGKEDYNWDVFDLAGEPDQNSAYMVGMQKVWSRKERVVLCRAEVLNSRISHLAAVRGQSPFYIHATLTQGHTYEGQVLGSAGAFGGGAAELWLESYSPGGRWSFGWTRLLKIGVQPLNPEVLHAVTAERRWLFERADVTAGITKVFDLSGTSARATERSTRLLVGTEGHW